MTEVRLDAITQPLMPPAEEGGQKKAAAPLVVPLGNNGNSGEVVRNMQTPDDGKVVLPRRRQANQKTILARAQRLQEELRLQKETPSLAIQQVYQVHTKSEFDELSPEERAKRVDEHIKKVGALQPPHSELTGLSVEEAEQRMRPWLDATSRLDEVKSGVGWQIQEAGHVTATIEISQFHQKATQMSNLIRLREVADGALMSNIELAMGLERISGFKPTDWTEALSLIPFMLLGEARAPTRVYLYQGPPFANPVLSKEADHWIKNRHLATKEAGRALNTLLGRDVMTARQQFMFSRMKSTVRPIASIIAQQLDQVAAIAAKPSVFSKALGGRVDMRDAEGKLNHAVIKALLEEELDKFKGMKTYAVTEAILHEFIFKLIDLGVIDEAITKENSRKVDVTQAK
jgi:hypothetical protein